MLLMESIKDREKDSTKKSRGRGRKSNQDHHWVFFKQKSSDAERFRRGRGRPMVS